MPLKDGGDRCDVGGENSRCRQRPGFDAKTRIGGDVPDCNGRRLIAHDERQRRVYHILRLRPHLRDYRRRNRHAGQRMV